MNQGDAFGSQNPSLQHVFQQVLRWMGYASGFNVQLMLVSEAIPWWSGSLSQLELCSSSLNEL